MLTAVVIDDEPDSIQAIKSMIQLYSLNATILDQANSVNGGLEIINKCKPSIVFLDIRLGDELAFDLLQKIDPINFQIIFISAYDQYAVQAFKYSAVDYLLKPIDPDELRSALERAENNLRAGSMGVKQIEALMQNMRASRPFLLSVPTSEGLEFIDINDIINIRAEGSYSVISLMNKPRKMISKNIGEFQDHLPSNEFCRVHNSYIVNLKYVRKMTRKGGLTAEMTEGTIVPISRNKKEAFMNKIEQYLYNKNS